MDIEKLIGDLVYYIYLCQEDCKEESKELEFNEIKTLVNYIEKLEKENRHLLDLQRNMDQQYEGLDKLNQELLKKVNDVR